VTLSRRRASETRVGEQKQEVRERVWTALEQGGVARFPGPRGRIPNFKGAEAAARRLAALPAWEAAEVVKANPDSPQLPVRIRALADGKRVYMAVPRLRGPKPFILLDPKRLRDDPRDAASIRGAAASGRPVRLQDVVHVDLIVCGTVAANAKGVRVGKGGGYSDLEFALLVERGLVDDSTTITTTVHPLQLLNEELPETQLDFRVHAIAMPDEVVETPRRKRPRGIVWDELDPQKEAAIPVLRALRRGVR
jgi:5-formyltetrahydrofolate cyclo-ligase